MAKPVAKSLDSYAGGGEVDLVVFVLFGKEFVRVGLVLENKKTIILTLSNSCSLILISTIYRKTLVESVDPGIRLVMNEKIPAYAVIKFPINKV